MSKGKLYKIKKNKNSNLIGFIVGILVYALVLILVRNLFADFYIKDFWYAIIAALILSALNVTVKPILRFLTFPLNLLTFGITYLLINMGILKMCDLLMGSNFVIKGFFSLFLVSIVISILKIIFDKLITESIGGK